MNIYLRVHRQRLLLPYVEYELSTDKDTDLEVTDIKIPSFLTLNDIQYGGGVTEEIQVKNTKELKTKTKHQYGFFLSISLDLLKNSIYE